MAEYDYQYLRREFLDSLRKPESPGWIDVRSIPPTPFEPVLASGPVYKHEIAYLDPRLGGWIVQSGVISFETLPFWMPLPPPPFPPA